jgi:hypothetical protein
LFLIAASFSSLAFIVVRRGDNHPTSPAPTAQRSSMGTPINETLVNDIAGRDFIAQQRNAVLVGWTGTGKIYLAIAIAHPSSRAARWISPGSRFTRISHGWSK